MLIIFCRGGICALAMARGVFRQRDGALYDNPNAGTADG
jgi:hypothetical protein